MSNSRLSNVRRLSCEPLETRRLLAGDGCGLGEELDAVLPAGAGLMSGDSVVSASNMTASDAGSTRGTATDIGNVDGTRRFSGRLGRFDRADVIRFSVQRDADLRIDLSGLNRNANLYLTDSSGTILDSSTRGGRRSERVTAEVDAGEYFVYVMARSIRTTRYRLSISATLDAVPAPPPAPTPPTTPSAPPSGAPTTPAPDPTPNVPAPLAEVADFGGSREWNLNAVGAPEAWATGYTGQGVTVAVVDTGVDLDHPDLVNNLFVNPGEIPGNGIDDDANGFIDDVHGYDFADNDADPNDVGGHGTHVAGTIAASKNSFGATGVAPDAKIIPVRVLGDDGSGSSLDVAAGIRYAAALGADIINLSLGGGYSRAIDAAIDYARSLGSLIVAAAGNESASRPGYPARFSASKDNVISVGAYNSSGSLARFSNDVGTSGAIQVDAPGVGIYSTYVGGRYGSLSGTSMASPHVAGLAALTLSSNPDLTSRELRELLASSTSGTAKGSDAIGKSDARTTVAFAAAGMTSAGTATSATNQASATVSAIRARRITVTSIPSTIGQTASEGSQRNQDAVQGRIADRPSHGTGDARVIVASFAAANQPSTRSSDVTDDLFVDDQWKSEDDSSQESTLLLLA